MEVSLSTAMALSMWKFPATADVFEFEYITKRGTELTCVVYDRRGFKEGAGGPICFEESPDGGIIAPLPRPQR